MDLERKSISLGCRTALIVVDVINGFTDPRCPLGCESGDVVLANAKIVNLFRERGLPIFFTTVVYRTATQAVVFRRRIPALEVLTPDSHWIQPDSRIGVTAMDALIEKQWASAFYETDLKQRLQRQGVDSLVVTGLTTSGCVRATVVDGLQNDYPVVIPREAVGDRNPAAHEANLFDMHAKYADVVSINDIPALLPDSGKQKL